MDYKFAQNDNFEDFAAGRVIYNAPGYTNFPVRLASEIFSRCYELINADGKVTLYDPCCGIGYLLTTLGFLHGDKISEIYGSDIATDALVLAEKNFQLLKNEGLVTRLKDLESKHLQFGKQSHQEAMISCEKLSQLLASDVKTTIFQRDVLDKDFKSKLPLIDVIICDVPYGELVEWESDFKSFDDITRMVDNLGKNLNNSGVLAVISDKKQKINSGTLVRVSKFQVGKRKVEFFRKKVDE